MSTDDPGPDRPARTRDETPHEDPETKRDVDRGRETAKDVLEDPEVVDDDTSDDTDGDSRERDQGEGVPDDD